MIKRLFKKASEQVVKQYEYYRVAIQQETEERARQQARVAQRQQQQLQAIKQQQQIGHHSQPKSPHTPRLQQHFNYPPPHSHIPHPQPHSPYGGGGVTSSGAYFDYHAQPPPSHELNNLNHHYPSSTPPMFSAGMRHHSSSNLQHHQIVGGSRVSGYPSNTGTRPGEMGAPNRTQSQNSLPHIPPNGHMLPGQLRSHTSAGSTFAEIFESKVSHLQDLEETFVWWCHWWVELASINQLSLLYHVSKVYFKIFYAVCCLHVFDTAWLYHVQSNDTPISSQIFMLKY